MPIRLPFFGLISMRSPMTGLLAHYEQIRIGMQLIEEFITSFLDVDQDSFNKEYPILQKELEEVEDEADSIKRHMRNHMPGSVFLPVEKHIFFLYTRAQDDILDGAQGALQWIALRPFHVEEFARDYLKDIFPEAIKTVELLRPALDATIAWVNSDTITRQEVKEHYWDVRRQHKLVNRMRLGIVPKIYSSEMNFKDIYQLLHVLEELHFMSHRAESCADLLRIMIAK